MYVDANVVCVCGGGPFSLLFTDNLLPAVEAKPKPVEQLEPLHDW